MAGVGKDFLSSCFPNKNMEAAFKIPSDLTLLNQFKALQAAVDVPAKAYQIWFLVWQDLFFRAQEGAPKGRLPAAAVPGLIRTLQEVQPDSETLFHKVVVEQSGLLQKDGEDYVCPRFMLLNAQVGKGAKESLGGSRKSFLSKQAKLSSHAFEQSLLIPPSKFVDGDGKKLDEDQVKRVMRLVISCDNALYKPERNELNYSEGLIQAALLVLRRFEDEEINVVVNRISKHRDHPALNGMITEKLLPLFGDIVGKLG